MLFHFIAVIILNVLWFKTRIGFEYFNFIEISDRESREVLWIVKINLPKGCSSLINTKLSNIFDILRLGPRMIYDGAKMSVYIYCSITPAVIHGYKASALKLKCLFLWWVGSPGQNGNYTNYRLESYYRK